ncbi:hypothetical protein AA103196_0021 [Ameyamaea chiangmaiensis NBRC 103196]|uniref:Uncharacterized protein n=1 Tax=Ameyamaea chiangmaiensis TaxID=442969 RepID=A0A850PDU5_9PROT|nr:hypothetical protein [Ameyamaea chiangmaiensis]MBS4076020.1 hypothetical protein [Ameyamaea chiangmaiensis]NVN40112.1 hypothetical protein [Ameyamaea chiangmaiensis]GBQ61437.1 hypothetical protein AA103196_0021 [Ameyamaea chiangmaiensis NBRC 103196]
MNKTAEGQLREVCRLLARLVGLLSTMADDASRVEGVVADIMTELPLISDETVSAAQQIDRLRQSLVDLASFFECLVPQSPEGSLRPMSEALEILQLDTVRTALTPG